MTEQERKEREFVITHKNNPIPRKMFDNIGRKIRYKGWALTECFVTTITGISGNGAVYYYASAGFCGESVRVDEFDLNFEFVDESNFN